MKDFEEIRREIAEIQAKHRARPERMRGTDVPYYRRGVMSIPGFRVSEGKEGDARTQSLRVMKKATTLPVDFFFYDLEDAAPDHPEHKKEARKLIIEALTQFDFGQRVVGIRPNNIRTAYFEEDLIEVLQKAGDRIDALVIPKTEYAEEVKDIVRLVRDIQRLSGHQRVPVLEVLIESPRAWLEAEKIAAIGGVSALAYGSWDFARTIGGMVTVDSWLQDHALARQMLPIVAAAWGKEAVDAVTVTLPLRPKKPAHLSQEAFDAALASPIEQLRSDVIGEELHAALCQRAEALAIARRDAEEARRIGYAAKWILHPDQIEVIQGAWSPLRPDALEALALVAHYTRAALRGSGAELDQGRLADKAVIGATWWQILAGLKAGTLTDEDIAQTGFDLATLRRTAVTHDQHHTLQAPPSQTKTPRLKG